MPDLLEVLQFRSNNEQYQPLIDALSVIIAYIDESGPYYPIDEKIPLDGVIQKQWQSWVYQQDRNSRQRIRRVRYELCVLQTLREKLRCKEIWVTTADRFRNPDEDVPTDFVQKREEYYSALDLPLDADKFIQQIQEEMRDGLQYLNDTLPENPDVEILDKDGGWIRVAPLDKQVEPTHLRSLKNYIRQHWWMTSLLDIIKEVDDRVAFTNVFHSLTGSERLPAKELRKRLSAMPLCSRDKRRINQCQHGQPWCQLRQSAVYTSPLYRPSLFAASRTTCRRCDNDHKATSYLGCERNVVCF